MPKGGRAWGDDTYTKRARTEGHAARSIYKLEELDRRFGLLRRGDRVLDLGAAPGSWTQYAAKKVGREGKVVAIDLKPITLALPPWVETLVGDAFEPAEGALVGPFDVVLSDMAPSTMGHHATDALRSAALCEAAMALAARFLRPGGHLVLKVLEGGEVPGLVRELKTTYTKVSRLRPQATRKQSTELFLVALVRRQDKAPKPEPLAAT